MPAGTGLDHFGLKLITPPATEPLTIGDGSGTDVKPWLRIDSDDTSQDALLATLITGARERCERVAGIALIAQTWQLTLDRFPGGYAGTLPGDPITAGGDYWRLGLDSDPRCIRLPRPPLQSITSLTYLDGNQTLQSLTEGTDFQVDADSEPARILPSYGNYFPYAIAVLGSITVTYVAGYTTVPNEIIMRLLTHVAYCFRERENQDTQYLDSLFECFANWGFR